MVENEFYPRRIWVNPDLLILQSRLNSPNYMGPGRWVLVNTGSRSSFVIVGKEGLPPLLKLLLEVNGKFLKNTEKFVVDGTIDKLLEKGILIADLPERSSDIQNEYLNNYQKIVCEYPFRDYHKEGWQAKDAKQMRQFELLSRQPSPITRRFGKKIKLPPADISIITENSEVDSFSKMDFLATILHITFSPFGRIKSSLPMLRKTSPSGGGRHPTEALIFYPGSDFAVKGWYYYDVSEHALVEAKDRDYDFALFDSMEPDCIAICLCIRVERPMWRYREPRSWRAVLIDVGHVSETLKLLIGAVGGRTYISHPPQDIGSQHSWVCEPEISLIIAYPKGHTEKTVAAGKVPKYPIAKSSSDILTSPCISLRIDGAKDLVVSVHWPEFKEVPISQKVFELITYCIPSRRGDRPSRREDLNQRFSIGNNEIDELINSGVLIFAECAVKLYDEIHLWSKHNWYMSFLAMVSEKSSRREFVLLAGGKEELLDFSANDLISSLYARKTTRRFSGQAAALSTIERVMKGSAIDYFEKDIRYFVVATNIKETERGRLYEWDSSAEKFSIRNGVLDCASIRAATIGQECAGVGVATIWIATKISFGDNIRYTDAIIQLGEIGQRICLISTAQGLGVFVTPAVCDQMTCEAIGLEDPHLQIIYTMTIGYEESRKI